MSRSSAAPATTAVSPPPLSLYVHFPWCVRKCPYCDFNSHEFGRDLPEEAYVSALIRDLDYMRPAAGRREIGSIFMGGGTPSLFSAAAMGRLLAAVHERLNLANDIEITLEANPGTLEAGRFAGYRAVGVNRLSIGVQSFDNERLAGLGRIHNADEARAAVRAAAAAGFDNINIDLMYGLPGQEPSGVLRDIEEALSLAPSHLSWYQLTIEPNTVFYSRMPSLPEEDAVLAMQEQGQQLLWQGGFQRYEVSAWSLPGREAGHNTNYWEFGDYLGLGAGAHSKLTDTDVFRVERSARHKIPSRYLETAGSTEAVTGRRVLCEGDLILEFMMNALRLQRGFHARLFEARTGLTLDRVRDKLGRAVQLGLLSMEGEVIRPTVRGTQFLNNLLQLF
jgi:putative oxygen-independent coproporphyrinogen III oxidase